MCGLITFFFFSLPSLCLISFCLFFTCKALHQKKKKMIKIEGPLKQNNVRGDHFQRRSNVLTLVFSLFFCCCSCCMWEVQGGMRWAHAHVQQLQRRSESVTSAYV